MIAYMSSEQIENISTSIFGNKWILHWEADRSLKQRLMEESNLTTPRFVKTKNDIDKLCIVKLHGAAGGRGYFLASDRQTFEEGARKLIEQKAITDEDELYIQEYVMGVPAYLQYFYSPITDELQLLGVDRRYESDIDGIGRIPSKQQLAIKLDPSYNVVGNIPIVLRESLLEEVFAMGERFVEASKHRVPPGMIGPFCLEGVYDRHGKFTVFEFSARIVAGTNLYVDGSPYSSLIFGEPMSMGRRIAYEIKMASKKGCLNNILT
jgi:5-formaminoimidazole-4-carboxamide-1-(beta)-D-ribofuranosyl 5'-monophosphate synthetase